MDVPERGTMLSDDEMGLNWLRQGNIFVVRLFIMRTLGEECVIVGRDCNVCVCVCVCVCVNNCTAGMRDMPDKYTENETNTA